MTGAGKTARAQGAVKTPAKGVVMALAAGLALAACGNSADLDATTGGEDLARVRTGLTQRFARGQEAQAAPLQPVRNVQEGTPGGFPGLDPALVAGQQVSIMGAYLEASGAVAGLAAAGQNGGVITWHTADGTALALAGGGIVTSTRGLGHDLHAADTARSAALIAAGHQGTVTRRHVYLDGNFRETTLTLTCTVTPEGRETLALGTRRHDTLRLSETCRTAPGTSPEAAFTNRYWRDANATLIRQSAQWIGPEAGTIYLQRLID